MGTKVQRESYLPVHHMMTNLEEDSNSCSWPLFNGDKTVANGEHCNGFPPRSMADPFSIHDKDVVRKTILKHEATFKSQVYELHHLYRIQKTLMDDLRNKESNRSRVAVEASFSSSPLASQITYEDARRSRMPGFPLENNPVNGRTSVSGVEDINHSILSSRKGSNSQMGSLPSRNGFGSKDVEILEDRPVKVRRKLIDLHLPADAYIDPEETTETKGDTVCGRSNGNLQKESGREFLRPNCLADLNEPVRIQENDAFADGYSHVVGNGESRGLEQSDGRKTHSVGLSKKSPLNSLHGREPLPMSYPHPEDIGSRRGWPPQVLGTGNYTGTPKSASLFLQPEKSPNSSRPVQVLSNNLHERQGFPAANASKAGSWREREFIDLEANTRNGVCENHLAGRSVSAQVHPLVNSPEKLSENSQRFGLIGDRWRSERSFGMNSIVSNNCSNRNGFDQGSSSFSREYPSKNRPLVGYSYQNGRIDYGRTPGNFKNQFCKDSNGWETKVTGDVNLNVAFSGNSIKEARYKEEKPRSLPWLQPKPSCKSYTNGQRDLNASHSSVLSSSMTRVDGSMRSLNPVWSPSLKSVSCSNKIEAKDRSANVKVLGCTISDKTCYRDKVASPMVDLNEVFDINMPSEPALPVSEEDKLLDNRNGTKAATSFRHQIDLNLSVSEDEDSFAPLSARSDMKVPVIDLEVPAVQEIEEYDGCGENSPEKSAKSLDELIQTAAEAIVAFSGPDEHIETDEIAPEASENCLQLFAETIISYDQTLERKLEAFSINKGFRNKRNLSSSEETDYFESMTLKLDEMKEEEYMPKPMIPKNLKPDESGPSFLPNQRPRRGNARRGRPRRDFQRDILPGLVSLSRHEVTEDIQTFGGLMRATGHEWNPGLARRKTGSKRGRPRLVPANPPNQTYTPPQNPVYPSPPQPQRLNDNINHHNNVETGLEDRSIGGWGNMTRRPRRQRCPPGNNRTQVTVT